jgi:hypothetical protein
MPGVHRKVWCDCKQCEGTGMVDTRTRDNHRNAHGRVTVRSAEVLDLEFLVLEAAVQSDDESEVDLTTHDHDHRYDDGCYAYPDSDSSDDVVTCTPSLRTHTHTHHTTHTHTHTHTHTTTDSTFAATFPGD